ncbi:MAG: dUTP diphosphatase [Candidatus Peribacteraceae bacterium]|nr:dUTP diphosphatase [Candidatus Peribacteraceae bacterium]
MDVTIQRIDPTLELPQYHTAGAAAFDLVTRETTTIEAGKIGLVPGNVIVKVPEGYALLILPRSSLPRKKALVCPHSLGLIDQDYHGPKDEIFVQVQNISDQPVTVERGDRIAQGLFVKIERATFKEVDSHPSTGSGPILGIGGVESRGGFGSTGEK